MVVFDSCNLFYEIGMGLIYPVMDGFISRVSLNGIAVCFTGVR